MAKKDKKISINEFEAALLADEPVYETLSGTDNTVMEIKKRIALTEMVSFVSEVVNSCIDAENGEYIPEGYDLAIRSCVLKYYANFTMPESIEKQYRLVYGTDAFRQVMESIDRTQFEDIVRAIDRKIKFMLDIMTASAVSEFRKMSEKIEKIVSEGEDIFRKIDPEKLKKAMDVFTTDGKPDEEKIVKALLSSRNEGEK